MHTNAFHFESLSRLDGGERGDIRAVCALNRLMTEVSPEGHALPTIVKSLISV